MERFGCVGAVFVWFGLKSGLKWAVFADLDKPGAGKLGSVFFQPVRIDQDEAGLFGPDRGLIGVVYKGREINRIILTKGS